MLAMFFATPALVTAQTKSSCPAPPPAYPLLAYDEDSSVVRDRNCRGDLWDAVKYLPLNSSGETYLSLGGQIRERYEYFSNANWGLGAQTPNGYLLQRYMIHADLHVGSGFRLFGELKSGLENGRNGGPRPSIDEDELDVNQAFLDVKLHDWEQGSVTLRAGRQEMTFGSSRLISVREGPNVRQSFDGIRLILAVNKWRIDAFATKPVETNAGVFDDSPDHTRSFWGAYATTAIPGRENGNIDLYYFGLDRKSATFNQGTEREQRPSVGSRLWGHPGPWDYNFEVLVQWGTFGRGNIRAWTVASDTGYAKHSWPLHPRIGLKADIASGDKNPASPDLQTFNGLFPKGAYFSEADLIGPANFADLHPSATLSLSKRLSLTVDGDFFWRESTHDGIYGVAVNLVRTGRLSNARYIGSHSSAEFEYRLDRHTTIIWNYLHFFPGPFLRETPPGRDVNYATAWFVYRF